ncbi:MAG: hypothetical protein Q9159_006782 [Coniocarpon cinnabarinum]
MATFKALNIESDDESEDEIDNTKEIQIEEALKFYQTALKYHASQKTLDKAGRAYEELFSSDIFKFPESQSEYHRAATYENLQDVDSGFVDATEAEVAVAPNAAENAPSTLPQILHLSFKNRAEYYLDVLRAEIEGQNGDRADLKARTSDLAQRALDDFAEALDKDEDNIDVWRRAARLSQALNSCRIARYCLETALEEDDEGPDNVLSLPHFEKKFDARALRSLQRHVEDDLSADLAGSGVNDSSPETRSSMEAALQLYPFLPETSSLPHGTDQLATREFEEKQRIHVEVEEHTMDAIAESLLKQLQSQTENGLAHSRSSAITLNLPPAGHDDPFKITWDGIGHGRSSENVGTSTSSHRPSHTPARQTPASEARPEKEVLAAQDRHEEHQPKSPSKSDAPRKRSSDMAGFPESMDGERGKSRRIRARKSTTAEGRAIETSGLDLTPGGDPRHETYLQADRWLFELMRDVLRRMEVRMIYMPDDIRRILNPNSPLGLGGNSRKTGIARALQDLYNAMLTWTPAKTDVLTNPGGRRQTSTEGRGDVGLLAFLDSTSTRTKRNTVPMTNEVQGYVQYVNKEALTLEQASVLFLQILLSEKRPHLDTLQWPEPVASPYLETTWTVKLRHNVEQIAELVNQELMDFVTLNAPRRLTSKYSRRHMFELVQSVFELHLDRHIKGTNPTSEYDKEHKTIHKFRVDQWSHLSREVLAVVLWQDQADFGIDAPSRKSLRALLLRHLWATVFALKASDEITREHHIISINDLKQQIRDAALPHGKLLMPNCDAMPEISIDAADREIVKLDTMDFFLSIFQESEQHPVDLIEKLEPILLPSAQAPLHDGRERRRDRKHQHASVSKSRQEILSEFVTKSDASLRLTLWYRLRDSYQAIEFPSKVLFVNLRILEVLMGEVQSYAYVQAEEGDRENTLLSRLRELDDVLTDVSTMIEAGNIGLDCLDIAQLKTSAQNLVTVFTLLHAVTLFDDHSQAIQKGPLLTNPFRTYSSEAFHPASIQLHSMQIRTFILIYRMMAEAAAQLPEKTTFAQANVDKYEYLQYVHYALGVRRLCKSSDNLYLRFMLHELNQLHGQPITNDVAQILYDLYDLKCFTSVQEKSDHGCEPDYLDRNTAMDLIDYVLDRAQGANIRDLPKADLGKSVEKIQTALGAPPSTFATSRNRRLINLYLKSPVSPMELFQGLQGVGSLSTTSCLAEDSPIASKGWYFLLGMINLAKHKRVRDNDNSKVSEDVNTAVKFFTHDLEYDTEKWESWFKLGQGYDWLHEEECLWQADKLNNKEVVQLQRSALHAYTQSTALAIRYARDNEDCRQKLSALQIEFAIRVYASARPPFNMQPFNLETYGERLQSAMNSGGTYGRLQFQPLREQQAMRVAATLCRRAIAFRPSHWLSHFMHGKCLWKMFSYVRSLGNIEIKLAMDALQSFHRACEVLERRRDPTRTEPTFEPIYKIVCIVEKMVAKQVLSPAQGAERIDLAWRTQKHVDTLQKVPEFEPSQNFKEHAIKCLKMVRQADRQRWHHRVVYKTAQLTCDSLLVMSSSPSPEPAKQAKDYLDKQNVYSAKTAALSVWKPENERPGRHWVYMTRYARFLVKLLDETDDAEFLQLFARRVRRKTNEFYEHTNLWEYVLDIYLRVHRRSQKVPLHAYSSVFADMNVEQFRPHADAVEAWACSPDTKHPLVELLREVEDVKKMNNKLVPDQATDDLICDIYAQIFSQIGKDLPLVDHKEKDKVDASAGATPAAGTPEPGQASHIPTPEKPKAMALANLMNSSEAASDSWRPIMAPGLSNAPLNNEPVPRSRAPRSVTRRDVMKRAGDLCVVKVTSVKDASDRDKARGTLKVVVNMSPPPGSGDNHGDKNRRNEPDDEGEGNAGGDDGSEASSELSDPDDNADDEMELDGNAADDDDSGGEEEIKAKENDETKAESPLKTPSFPGLAGRRSISEATLDSQAKVAQGQGKKDDEAVFD